MKWRAEGAGMLTSGHVYDASLLLRLLDVMTRRCLGDGYV